MDRRERRKEREIGLEKLLGCECNVPIPLEEKEVCLMRKSVWTLHRDYVSERVSECVNVRVDG